VIFLLFEFLIMPSPSYLPRKGACGLWLLVRRDISPIALEAFAIESAIATHEIIAWEYLRRTK